jgi:hypothetical protein
VVTAAAVIIDPMTSNETLIIINQALYNCDPEQHESLLHSDQARFHGVIINDIAACYIDEYGNQGRQNLYVEGQELPLHHDGVKYYLRIRPPTPDDWKTKQIVELTSPLPWNDMTRSTALRRQRKGPEYSENEIKDWGDRLGHISRDLTLRTLANTTQLVANVEAETRLMPQKHIMSRLLSLRPRRTREGFCTDPFFASTKSYRGFTCAQVFVGRESDLVHVDLMKGKGYAPQALQNFIRTVGAPAYIMADNAPEEQEGEWAQICRTYCIPQRASETKYQHQNRVERSIQDIKRRTRLLLHLNDAPEKFWDYAVQLAVDMMNHTARRKLEWKTPYEVHYGETPDISVFRFHFYEPIFYLDPTASFPQANMLPGRYLGIARTTGDAFTFHIITDRPNGRNVVLTRSVIRRRSLNDPDQYAMYSHLDELPNEDLMGNTSNEEELNTDILQEQLPINFSTETDGMLTNPSLLLPTENGELTTSPTTNDEDKEGILILDDIPIQSTNDLLLKHIIEADPEEIIINGQHASYEDHDPTTKNVIMQLEDGTYKEIPTEEVYNHMEETTQPQEISRYIALKYSDTSGKLYVQVELTSGDEEIYDANKLKIDEPQKLASFIRSHPVERTQKGYWNNWALETMKAINITTRRVRNIYYDHHGSSRIVLRRTKKHQTKPAFRTVLAIKMGVEVPRTVKEALELDLKNGNNKWQEGIKREMDGLHEHQTFRFLPPGSSAPEGYQLAPLRMVFEVKSDLRRKARLVIGGHRIDASEHSGCSSVVQLSSIRLLNVIAKSQGLECLAGDVGNAYLNAKTKEKVYIKCGLEFGPEMEGRIAIVDKGLYGLKSSGNRWHAHFAQTLYGMGFIPSRYDQDVWLRKREDESGYDYISTYVDDFMITAKDPWHFMTQLQRIYKIKDPAHPEVYLGALYTGSPSTNWTISSQRYIKEAIIQLERSYGMKIQEERTPCKTNDHPEEDQSPMLDNEKHRQYQSMIGMAQWLVTLGRLDICYAVSSLSRYCSAPREGHLARVYRLWGYIKKYPNKSISINASEPRYHPVKPEEFKADFEDQYRYAKEEFDPRFPKPLGAELDTTIFFDSDHAHDKKTGRSISGVLTMVGCTPIIWKSRRQGAVQTSTYGAEFCAMRLATEEAINIRYMLRSLGIRVTQPTKLFGDNLGVIQNASVPDATLKKKHVALSYHCVREAIAAKITAPYKLDSKDNFADVLTKPLERGSFLHHVKDLLWGSATTPNQGISGIGITV